MLPPIVTQTVEHLTSTVISFAIIMVAGAFFIALILANSFGGKSQVKRLVLQVLT